MKNIHTKYKVLLALCILVLGIILFFLGSLFLQKKDIEIKNKTQITKPMVTTQKKIEIFETLENNESNFALKDEKLEFLDKNISEILNLNNNTQENKIKNDDINLSTEQNSSNNIQLENIKQISKIDENLTKQINNEQNLTSQQVKKQLHQTKSSKPSLAIIIDDMASHTHVDMLKKTNLKLIPSFFPPDRRHPYTAELAKDFEFFMVHLPLAAIKYDKAELNTLEPKDSKEVIFKRIAYIKKHFPNLKFINNHTGSLFTADEIAMKNLFDAFLKNDFIFVDSRTIGNSKAPKLAKQYHQPYIARDVFLDNEDNIEYIKKQIMQVVNEAKAKGFAIAIAHPRKNTFEALVQSKELLNSVELVYLNEIYK